jgi:hypothetical protein
MSDLQVTAAFVKKLTKNIRNKYGLEPSHTEVMELVADALGRQLGPLMHALKNDKPEVSVASPQPGFSLQVVDPIPQAINDARPLHKIGSISYEDVARIMDLVSKPGILLIVCEKASEANDYAVAVAKAWSVRVGSFDCKPYVSKHEVRPFSKELGVVLSCLDHLASTNVDPVIEGRFAMIGVAGSPLNIERAIESSDSRPTIATISRASLRLLANFDSSANAYWATAEAQRDQENCLNTLSSTTMTILDVENIGGRFQRSKLRTWENWVKEQEEQA